MNHDAIVQATRCWLERVVIDLNLCPFAKREWVKNRVRLSVVDSSSVEELLRSLQSELVLLDKDPAIETTLLIHPQALNNFFDYNDFLDIADALLIDLGYEGVYQIASFHPDYQFAEADEDDVSHYTNRSPYPMLHLLREASLTQAIEAYDDVDSIPQRNVQLMQDMGLQRVQDLVASCHKDACFEG